jgi:hypothetical protein
VGCGNAICLASEYDLKEIIPCLMTNFERLNPSIQAKVVASIDRLPVEEKKKPTCFVLGHLWKSLHGHSLLGNYICFRG